MLIAHCLLSAHFFLSSRSALKFIFDLVLQATLNEVRVLAMLRHPHIIQYYDSFLHESAMMIVMEYAAGGTLHDLIEEAKAKDEGYCYLQEEEEIAFLFAQIILPMHYIHSQNILHRDLKAQNIFLTKNKNFAKVSSEKNKNSLLPSKPFQN